LNATIEKFKFERSSDNCMPNKLTLPAPALVLVGCESKHDYKKCVHLRDTRRLKNLGVDVDNAQQIVIVNGRRKIVFLRQGNRNRFKAFWRPGMPEPSVGQTVELKVRVLYVTTREDATARLGTRLA